MKKMIWHNLPELPSSSQHIIVCTTDSYISRYAYYLAPKKIFIRSWEDDTPINHVWAWMYMPNLPDDIQMMGECAG